jgi:hypothetical protein
VFGFPHLPEERQMETEWRDSKNQEVGDIALTESNCALHVFRV